MRKVENDFLWLRRFISDKFVSLASVTIFRGQNESTASKTFQAEADLGVSINTCVLSTVIM